MTLHLYELDREAQKLILEYRDLEDVLNESHKMRSTVAYGLERFWGEHLRLWTQSQPKLTRNSKRKPNRKPEQQKSKNKGDYWWKVWMVLVEIFREEFYIPYSEITDLEDESQISEITKTKNIKETAGKFWDEEIFPVENRKIALAVLTQFCDSLIWWTQRYKKSK